jgi:CheY-like chemotaxis protein
MPATSISPAYYTSSDKAPPVAAPPTIPQPRDRFELDDNCVAMSSQQKVMTLHVLTALSSSHISEHQFDRCEGAAMLLDVFSRKLVLLVEDEPLIALDVEDHLRKAGARVITAGYLDAALYMAEHPDLSGGIVDIRLGVENAMPICRRLVHRNLPFVVHTGYAADAVQREWPSVPIIQKPAKAEEIIDALSRSLSTADHRIARPRPVQPHGLRLSRRGRHRAISE